MTAQINLGGISVDVVFKNIKNVHLSVHPPTGRVRISAPERMKIETIRIFAISKLGWIKRQQITLLGQERETPREYLDRESHYIWGKRYLLKISESENPPAIELKGNRLLLQVRPGADKQKRHNLLEEWYREQLASTCPLVERCPERQHRRGDVVERGQRRKQVKTLKHEADAPPVHGTRRAAQRADVATVNADGSAVDDIHRTRDVQQRRLARP